MTYRNNLCPSSPGSVVEGDVRDLDIPGLRSRFGNIDAFAYGFPCNSFSSLGKHNGIANKKFGQLYWYGVEVLREYQPDWFLAENVSGIRSAGTGDFRKILQDLRESGYDLVVHLYKAEDYGIPQTRHRVIIVGIRNDLDVTFQVPDPEHRHQPGSDTSEISVFPWPPLPEKRPVPSRDSGSGLSEIQNRGFCPWLFLAPAPRMPLCNDSSHQHGILEPKVPGQYRARPKSRFRTFRPWMEHHNGLGMRTEKSGEDGDLRTGLRRNHREPPLNRISFY